MCKFPCWKWSLMRKNRRNLAIDYTWHSSYTTWTHKPGISSILNIKQGRIDLLLMSVCNPEKKCFSFNEGRFIIKNISKSDIIVNRLFYIVLWNVICRINLNLNTQWFKSSHGKIQFCQLLVKNYGKKQVLLNVLTSNSMESEHIFY